MDKQFFTTEFLTEEKGRIDRYRGLRNFFNNILTKRQEIRNVLPLPSSIQYVASARDVQTLTRASFQVHTCQNKLWQIRCIPK